MRRDGRATVVGAAELVVGDVVLLEAGHRVCADSTQTGGRPSIDESMLAGESTHRPSRTGQPGPGRHLRGGGAGDAWTPPWPLPAWPGVSAATESAARPRSPLTGQLHQLVKVIGLTGNRLLLCAIAFGIPLCQAPTDATTARTARRHHPQRNRVDARSPRSAGRVVRRHRRQSPPHARTKVPTAGVLRRYRMP